MVAAPAAAPQNNGGQPWGQPYEARAEEFEKKESPWDGLYADVLLRLEKTPAHKAIVYPFKTDHDADRAYEAISRRARLRLGKGHVISGTRRDPPRMFVRRGPNWGRTERRESDED